MHAAHPTTRQRRSRTATRLAVTLAAAAALGTALTACGTSQEAPKATPSVITPPAGSSVPVVAGPNPVTSKTAATSTPEKAGSCGATKGPDGALQVTLVDGDVTCETAMSIAKEYGPLIASGTPQSVSGWDCGPSTTDGELARCSKGGQTFALVP